MNEIELRDSLLEKIPLTHHMALEVTACNLDEVSIKAGYEENRNHKNTGFGGSLNSVMTLACWSWLTNYLEHRGIEEQCNVVIHECQTKFIKPVTRDFIATCLAPSEEEMTRFLKVYERMGVGRLSLTSDIREEGGEAVASSFSGQFVAIKKQ